MSTNNTVTGVSWPRAAWSAMSPHAHARRCVSKPGERADARNRTRTRTRTLRVRVRMLVEFASGAPRVDAHICAAGFRHFTTSPPTPKRWPATALQDLWRNDRKATIRLVEQGEQRQQIQAAAFDREIVGEDHVAKSRLTDHQPQEEVARQPDGCIRGRLGL